MKTTITILLTLFITIHCNSQIKVYLKNGEVKEGRIGLFKGENFKLKQTKKGKSEKFKAEDTDSVLFISKRKTDVFHSIEYKKRKFSFYKLHVRGSKVDAYIMEQNTTNTYVNSKSIHYPIHRKNEIGFARFNKNTNYNKSNWAKNVIEYFSDCPNLTEKIKNEEKNFYEKDDILNIVDYYNNECK